MKFNIQLEINQNKSKLVELFEDPTKLGDWQDGFISFEHLSGEAKTEGAKSKFVYNMGKGGPMEHIETIINYNLPDELYARYDHAHMSNTILVKFEALNENLTRMIYEVDYVEFKSFFIKVIAFINPGMFRRQTEKWLKQFKALAEKD